MTTFRSLSSANGLPFSRAGLVLGVLVAMSTQCGRAVHEGEGFGPPLEGGAAEGGTEDASVPQETGVAEAEPLVLPDSSVRSEAAVQVDLCHVSHDNPNGNAPLCTKSSPPNAFSPATKWTWTAPPPPSSGGIEGSMVTPLVANLTDDNKDGEINLCDIPDVIVVTNGGSPGIAGQIFMLAGDTGAVETTFDGDVDSSVTPALGDIDGDGIPEVVTNDVAGHLLAYDHAGHLKWTGDVAKYVGNGSSAVGSSYCQAIAIHDLDGDGTPEIICAFEVFDNKGHSKFSHDESAFEGQYWCPASTAADLDGDGKLEVLFGNAALHSDGSIYWTLPGPPGQPQVADFDGDGIPEIFVARQDGLLVVSHDGKVLAGPTQSFDPQVSPNCWSKAGAIGDFDGTGHPSIMDGSCAHFGIWHVGASALTLAWSASISDPSGVASSTAFDFLGRGVHDAVYGDEDNLWVYDGKSGAVEFSRPRNSGTLIEYPVVADVDNDGSADIVVVSNKGGENSQNYKNTVEVFQDAQKRWIPARRIWNQHAYYVSNVNEDGTIPSHPTPSYKLLNTFRVNSQIEGGGDCIPPKPIPM
jgi:hypothetical protein